MTAALPPGPTLAGRALARLGAGACTSETLCGEVLGLGGAGPVIAERVVHALLGADPRACRLPDGRWALAAPGAAGAPGAPGDAIARALDSVAFAVVDVETTGTRADGDDRVTEIAVVLQQGIRREVLFSSLVDPGRPIPPWAQAVTGITDAMVRGAPTFGQVADRVLEALAGRVFTAHNARFDWGFVAAELRRSGGLALTGPRLCTVRLARKLVGGGGSCGLDALTARFGFENPARHRAAGDALVTAMLLERLLPLARAGGAATLDDLLTLAGRNPS
ncbi:MAG: 3'-5' exonuclease [Gemmatimonadales bacterium]|nr:3'-5' exonuclease [Gemmatimonadales bacterium]